MPGSVHVSSFAFTKMGSPQLSLGVGDDAVSEVGGDLGSGMQSPELGSWSY